MIIRRRLCVVALMSASVAVPSRSFPVAPVVAFRPSTIPSWRLGSAVSDATTESTSVEQPPQQCPPTRVSVRRPVVHWTVPGFKVGWQDEDGQWFDEDGPREGPPLNYWRQRADERAYQTDLNLVDRMLRSSSSSSDSAEDAHGTVSGMVRKLEGRNSVRRPALSRKLLGTWAPLWNHDGLCARETTRDDDDDSMVETPGTIRVYRTRGPLFAPRIAYGTFPRPLAEGEEISIETDTATTVLRVDATNPRHALPPGLLWPRDEEAAGWFGNITYISDYLLIMRGAGTPDHDHDDDKFDVWMRCDDSHLPEEGKVGYVKPTPPKEDKQEQDKVSK